MKVFVEHDNVEFGLWQWIQSIGKCICRMTEKDFEKYPLSTFVFMPWCWITDLAELAVLNGTIDTAKGIGAMVPRLCLGKRDQSVLQLIDNRQWKWVGSLRLLMLRNDQLRALACHTPLYETSETTELQGACGRISERHGSRQEQSSVSTS